ncbi:MAG TPA: dienelactone hydrolase family protein [Candidatus Limnocylindria bacterium]|nr:dienelactone hydrolase family protein [Candidatus Limnocylindria bacterium]
MCTSHDSRPPIEPISGAAHDSERITLQGADGAAFNAFLARPEQGTGAGIVILPDVRGLHPFFEELALRYAERGIAAMAIDYFGRTAGTAPRGDSFEHMPHVEQATWKHLEGDIRAAVTYLRSLDPAPRSIFTTGFCMGGRLSSMSATLGLGLAGVIPFYGWPVGPNRNGTPAPAENASKIECDVLAFYGEADSGIPEEVRKAYDAALAKAGVRHETVVYPDAPHGFFDRKAGESVDAAADAWDRTLKFIRRHTQGQPIAGGSPPRGATASDG